MNPLESEGVHPECGFCGSHVSDDFRRVFGDADGDVHRCLSCDSRPQIQVGSAAGEIGTPARTSREIYICK